MRVLLIEDDELLGDGVRAGINNPNSRDIIDKIIAHAQKHLPANQFEPVAPY